MGEGREAVRVLFPVIPERERVFCIDDAEQVVSPFAVAEGGLCSAFAVAARDFPDAVLGVVDRYTLGELDRHTLDLKMWPDRSRLVPYGGAGADGTGIFDYTEPLQVPMRFLRAFCGDFVLDAEFFGGYGMAVKPLYMALYSNSAPEKPILIFEKDMAGSTTAMYLVNDRAQLLRQIELACRSIMGHKWALGEMDVFSLGQLDPVPLWYFSQQAAAGMQLSTAAADAGIKIEPSMERAQAQLRIEGVGRLSMQAQIAAEDDFKRLSGLTSRRAPVLGELDGLTLGELSTRTLNMYVYGKIPAVITAGT